MEWLAAIIGLFAGGVLNVVADRVPPLDPEWDGPFVADRPRKLALWEWLPMASWLSASRSTRMKVRNSPLRYPILEIAVAAAAALAWARFGDDAPIAIAVAVFAAILVTLAAIDFETKNLPFRVVIPLAAAGLVFAPFWPDMQPWHPFAGAALGFAIFFPIYWLGEKLGRPLMGGGDAYLAAAMGAILGTQMLLLGLYIGVIVGGLVGIGVYAARAFGVRQRVIAYGPYLSFGGLVALYYGRTIVDWLTSQV